MDVLRPTSYYDAPDLGEYSEDAIFNDISSLRLITRDLFLNPSLALGREMWSGLLWELHNTTNAQAAGYDARQVALTIAHLQKLLTQTGLVLGEEIVSIQEGEQLTPIDIRPKYIPQNELFDYADQWKYDGEVIGLVHGSLDPTHIGHSRAAFGIYPYCNRVIVGFDPDSVTRQRKGPDRPRFPLAYRMSQMAGLPIVGNVFVLPISELTDEKFTELYRRLNVKVLGSASNNSLIETYRHRMGEMGGTVIEIDEVFWSSTLMMEHLNTVASIISADSAMSVAKTVNEQALKLGFLRDFPDAKT